MPRHDRFTTPTSKAERRRIRARRERAKLLAANRPRRPRPAPEAGVAPLASWWATTSGGRR